MRARVLTLNLQGLANAWFERRFDAVVEGLRPLAPDVLCLQEATVLREEGVYHQAVAIAEAVGLDFVAFGSYGPPAPSAGSDHGVAVVSRWPLRRVRDRRLRDPRDERVVFLATLMAPGGDLEVITTHLAWEPAETELRARQARTVFDELQVNGWHRPGSRVIVAGDFNATEDEPVICTASQGLVDVFRARHPDAPGYTWLASTPYTAGYGHLPDRRLDYIFCPRGVEILDARVVLDHPTPVFPSDHFGVMADLAWAD